MVAGKSSSSPVLLQMRGENPFSPDAIRSRQTIAFPDIDPNRLSRREGKIVRKAREDALAIGFGAIKGTLAVAETDALEDFTNARFLATSTRIAQRLRAAHALCPFEEFQRIQNTFSLEGVRRMGAAMAAMVDTTEQELTEVVARPLALEEEQSVFALVFGRRR